MRTKLSPEFVFTIALSLYTIAISLLLGAPIIFPSGETTIFIGYHYLIGCIPIAIFIISSHTKFKSSLNFPNAINGITTILIFFLVMICHFNLKSWVPLINPSLHDGYLYEIDNSLHKILLIMSYGAQFGDYLFSWVDNPYHVIFVFLFIIVPTTTAIYKPFMLRHLFFSTILVQGIGAVTYSIFPALGPMFYFGGTDPLGMQMLEMNEKIRQMGTDWMEINGHKYFCSAIAAMPSLHVAASVIFSYFALKTNKIYGFFIFLLTTIIACWATSKGWHYLLDLPCGFLLAIVCIRISEMSLRKK